MRSSFLLAVVMLMSTLVVRGVAQEQNEATAPGPIRRSVSREITRLAASPGPMLDIEQRLSRSPDQSDWSRVVRLAPQTDILVTTKGGLRRTSIHFVTANNVELIVSNRSGQVEHIARVDVAEVAVLSKHIGRHLMWGAIVGAAVGTALGVVASTDCQTTNPRDQHLCDGGTAGYAFGGAVLGAGPGALMGLLIGAGDPASPDLIYRLGEATPTRSQVRSPVPQSSNQSRHPH